VQKPIYPSKQRPQENVVWKRTLKTGNGPGYNILKKKLGSAGREAILGGEDMFKIIGFRGRDSGDPLGGGKGREKLKGKCPRSTENQQTEGRKVDCQKNDRREPHPGVGRRTQVYYKTSIGK